MQPENKQHSGSVGINPWIIFALICVPIFIGSVDLTAIVVVLPQAALDLLGAKGLPRSDLALWAVTAYLLAYTLSLTLAGRLSDVISRKKIFIGCIVIFILGSLWASEATGLPLDVLKLLPVWSDTSILPLISFVVGRIIQAIGAGASVSVGMALVSDIFPPEQRTRPISLISGLDSLGWVVGNLGGGLILQVLPSWRWLFLISAAVAVPSLILVTWALRNTQSTTSEGKFDWRAGVLFGAALTGLTVGVEALGRVGADGYILTGLSVVLFLLLGWTQVRKHKDALFDVAFIRQREILVALVTNFIVGFGIILMVAGVPLFINLRTVFLRGEGLLTGALHAGIMLCAMTGPLLIAILVGERQFHRVGPAIPVAAGLLLSAVGFLASNLWTYTAPTVVIALPLALVGIGLGLAIGPLSLIVVEAADLSARGMASSLVLMMRLLGMTIGAPLAGSLTLTMANDWASQHVEGMTTYHDIARAMLVPPMATDALARVLLTGAALSALGLVVFYLPRTIQAVRAGSKMRRLVSGWALLLGVFALVGGLALTDRSAPSAAHPIADLLPANVQSYVAMNIQRVFLQNTSRPLDAVTALFTAVLSKAGPSASAPTSQPAPNITPTPDPNGSGSTAPGQPAQPSGQPPDDLAGILKVMFRVANWAPEQYRSFCQDPIPAESDRWRDCFSGGLLSWIGPQVGAASWPVEAASSLGQYDFLVALQATNRNNAVLFVTQLAEALRVKEPVQVAPNVSVMTINADSPEARQIAITEAYVLVGTPAAIQATLKGGHASLADQPDFQAAMSRLDTNEAFVSGFIRSDKIDADLHSLLISTLGSNQIDNVWKIAGSIPLLSFIRTASAPVVVGVALRIDQQQLGVKLVVDFPYSLQNVNVLPVPDSLLQMIPVGSPLWGAAGLNISEIVRKLDVMSMLATIARETKNTDLTTSLSNPVFSGLLGTIQNSAKNLLVHARGQILVMTLQNSDIVADPARLARNIAILIPMDDALDPAMTSEAALTAITQEINLIGGLSRLVTVKTDKQVTTLSGPVVQQAGLTTVRYALTANKLLVLSTVDDRATFDSLVASLGNAKADPSVVGITGKLPDQFIYGYANTDTSGAKSDVWLGGKIDRQTLYLNVILQSK